MTMKSKILNRDAINKKIIRLSWEIYENNINKKEIFIIGVKGRGELISKELCRELNNISKIKINIGTICINKENPINDKITSDFNVVDCENSIVILVDDVLNSGRTLMYASSFFLNISILKLSTLVLVNRTHTRYPIKADYVGLSLATTLKEYINVILTGDNQGVYLN